MAYTRVIAEASDFCDEPVVPGWHGTEPLSATWILPVVPHSRRQCGPPTLEAVPSARVSSDGQMRILRIFMVAASMSSTWWPLIRDRRSEMTEPVEPAPTTMVSYFILRE